MNKTLFLLIPTIIVLIFISFLAGVFLCAKAITATCDENLGIRIDGVEYICFNWETYKNSWSFGVRKETDLKGN